MSHVYVFTTLNDPINLQPESGRNPDGAPLIQLCAIRPPAGVRPEAGGRPDAGWRTFQSNVRRPASGRPPAGCRFGLSMLPTPAGPCTCPITISANVHKILRRGFSCITAFAGFALSAVLHRLRGGPPLTPRHDVSQSQRCHICLPLLCPCG